MKFRKAFLVSTKASSRFYKYFFSYVIILLITLIIMGTVVYREFIITLQSEIESSNVSALRQLKESLDMRMREMERTALDINTNLNLKSFKFLNVGYDIVESLDELRQYKSGNEFIIDLALYDINGETNKIISTKTDVTLEVFFKYFYKYEQWGLAEFNTLIDKMNAPVMRPVEPILEDNVYNRRIATYIYPLPPKSKKAQRVVLYFIDEGVLKSLIKDVLKEYDGLVYILDDNEQPIICMSGNSSSLDEEDMLIRLEPGKLQQGVSKLTINKENFSVVKVPSDYNKWSYIIVMSTNQFMNKVYQKRGLFIYAIFSVLILGLITSYSFAIRNYRPLKNLADMLTKRKSSDMFNNIDEFHVISNAILEVTKENTELMADIRSKSSLLRDQNILGLLKGKISSLEEAAQAGDISSLRLDYPYFLVALFFIDDYLLFNQKNNRQTQELIKFSIINAIEELGQELGCAYGVELDNDRSIAILLNIENFAAAESGIKFLAAKIKNFFYEHFRFTLTIGVGSIYRDLSMVSESFIEAEKAVSHRLVIGNDSIIFYEHIKDKNKAGYKYPSELETKLCMAIKQGKSDEVAATTGQIMQYVKTNEISLQATKNICYGIINSILKSLIEIGIEVDENSGKEWDKLFSTPVETLDELSERLIDFGCKICNYIAMKKESKNFELRDKIISIIERRYAESLLTLEHIVSDCGLSQSYICRYFKDQTGYSIMQYVDSLRMNKAKQLLRDTQLELRDILDQTGYIDESNFIRKFRTKEGVTPMKFRSMSNRSVNSHEQ